MGVETDAASEKKEDSESGEDSESEEDEEAAPGVYTGICHPLWDRVADEEDAGPQTPVAGITQLRWLGTTRDFIKFAKESRSDLGEQRYARLMEMLQAGPHDSSDADSQ